MLFFSIVFIFGIIIGSFLNVVVYRYGTGQGVARGRSKCFSCRKVLVWYELLPIVSFLVLRARCSSCKSKISWQYPLVELFTGLVFVGVFWSFGFTLLTFLFWVAAALLIAIAVYDWHHLIIPDGLVYAFIVVASLSRLSFSGGGLAAIYTTLGLFIFFWALWYFSDGAWMGFGDAKLVVGIGLLLGWPLGLSAIIIAFWLGAIVGVALLVWQKLVHIKRSRKGGQLVTMKTEVPFAPFLVLATLLVLIFQINVIPLF